jgi:hypothetical protein
MNAHKIWDASLRGPQARGNPDGIMDCRADALLAMTAGKYGHH